MKRVRKRKRRSKNNQKRHRYRNHNCVIYKIGTTLIILQPNNFKQVHDNNKEIKAQKITQIFLPLANDAWVVAGAIDQYWAWFDLINPINCVGLYLSNDGVPFQPERYSQA